MNFLARYEQWLKDENCTEITISLLFRTLRSAYNKAITAKYAHKGSYPFSDFKVSKFDVSTQKRAIPKDAIKKIINVDLSREQFYIQFSRDVFIFSYLCGGINFTDIANLKFSNLINNKLSYIRKKTKKKIATPLSNEAIQIVKKYAVSNKDSNNYMLPLKYLFRSS